MEVENCKKLLEDKNSTILNLEQRLLDEKN